MKRTRRPNGPPGETLEEWGYRTARETGYDAGNLRGLCTRTWGIRITDETAKRWATEARRPGMKLWTFTDRNKPWKTNAGHTITEYQPGRYRLSAPGWDHPVLFNAPDSRRAFLALQKHLGPLHLYVDGVYADGEPETIEDRKIEAEGEQLNAFDPIQQPDKPARRLAA